MKRLIVAMALTAGSVFLAAPASADEGTTEVTAEAASEQAPPAAEEPAAEPPAAEEPAAEPPVAEEPVVEEPVAEEPVVEEPVAEEPVVEEPAVEEPVVEDPTALAAATVVEAAKAKEYSNKVFVCKYVNIPNENELLQVVISVAVDSIFPQFKGNPLVLVGQLFPDAHGDSKVIAVDDGQEKPSIEACSVVLPEYVEADPPSKTNPTCDKDGKLKVPADTDEITYVSEPGGTGPGSYTVTATAAEGLTLTDDGIFHITVKKQLTGDECDPPPAIEPTALLPDTGGEPMWMFPVGGAMALGGVLLLRATRRTATSEMGGSGNPGHSLALVPRLMNDPVKVLKEAPARVSISTSPQVRSEWAAVAGGLALAAIAVYFRSRFR